MAQSNESLIAYIGPALRGFLAKGKGTLPLVAFGPQPLRDRPSAPKGQALSPSGTGPQQVEVSVPSTASSDEVVTVLQQALSHAEQSLEHIVVPEIGMFSVRYIDDGFKGRVAGKVAVVTGAAQGFGLEIAQHLASQGALVVLADINAEAAEKEAEALQRRYGQDRAKALSLNVTESASIEKALMTVVKTWGGLDIFVSNAGVLKADSVKTQTVQDFKFVTEVNYTGYFQCVRQVAPILAQQHAANQAYLSDIIQINSKSGLVGSNRNAAYAGSKFGGIGLTESFAMELIDDGIKVNAICPGNFFEGPLWSDPDNGLFVQYLRTDKVPGAKTIEDVKKAYEAKVPMKRGCTTADVMKALYYLIEQQYETGQAVPVTGGQVMLH